MRAQFLVLALAFLVATVPASAGPVLTNPTTFLSQLEPGAIGVITFDGTTTGNQSSPFSIFNAVYSMQVSSPGGLYWGEDHNDEFLRVRVAQDIMTITFGAGINAFGAVIYQTNHAPTNGNTVPVVVTFTDNLDHSFVYDFTTPSNTTFLGYTTPWGTYLKSATITGTNPANAHITLDDVVAGFDTPEPASILLCGLGLIAAGLLKRRR